MFTNYLPELLNATRITLVAEPKAEMPSFLRFAIENALAGNIDLLKEYVIGTEVYDRKPPYHPSQDSIVRTEARRLRAKLKDYYESEGKQDPVFIYFRPGTYVPLFRRNESIAAASPDAASAESDLLVHDEHDPRPVYAFLLAHMEHREGFPTPIGVLRASDELPRYEDVANQQIADIIAKKGPGDISKLLNTGDTWVVK